MEFVHETKMRVVCGGLLDCHLAIVRLICKPCYRDVASSRFLPVLDVFNTDPDRHLDPEFGAQKFGYPPTHPSMHPSIHPPSAARP